MCQFIYIKKNWEQKGLVQSSGCELYVLWNLKIIPLSPKLKSTMGDTDSMWSSTKAPFTITDIPSSLITVTSSLLTSSNSPEGKFFYQNQLILYLDMWIYHNLTKNIDFKTSQFYFFKQDSIT